MGRPLVRGVPRVEIALRTGLKTWQYGAMH
jgi:hypothetical protein